MRVFDIQPDGKFREYVQTPFKVEHEEEVLEDWLESNPDGIVEDGRLLIIGRQVETNLGGFIDLLALDREGTLVVLELKRDRTPRDTLAQALEYASSAEQLDADQLEGILRSYLTDDSLSLAEHHRAYFQIGPEEAVTFNKDQRIVLVGQKVTPEIRQTASYLRAKGLRVTCLEFTFFQASGGTRLLSQEIVVGQEAPRPGKIASGSLPVVTQTAFLDSLDANGKLVFSRILKFAEERAMPIRWGMKGFSLNVDLDGTLVAICYGYPPGSVYKQSFYTALVGQGGMGRKVAIPDTGIKALWDIALATNLFVPAGRELKCAINREFSNEEIAALLAWCENLAQAVREHGLKQ